MKIVGFKWPNSLQLGFVSQGAVSVRKKIIYVNTNLKVKKSSTELKGHTGYI